MFVRVCWTTPSHTCRRGQGRWRHLRREITYIRSPVLGYRRTTGLQRKHGSSVHTSGHTSGVIRCSVRADTPAGNMAPAETRSIHGSSGHTIITTSSYQHHSIQDLRVRSWLRAQRAVQAANKKVQRMATQGHAKAHSWTWGAQLDVNDHKGIIRFSAPPRGVTVPLRLLPSACSRLLPPNEPPTYVRSSCASPGRRSTMPHPITELRKASSGPSPNGLGTALRKLHRPQHPAAHRPLSTCICSANCMPRTPGAALADDSRS